MCELKKMLVLFILLCHVFAHETQRLGTEENTLQNPRVCIDDGCLRGKTMEGYQAGPFNAFIGIPYAKPPTEELRFSVSIALNKNVQIITIFTRRIQSVMNLGKEE